MNRRATSGGVDSRPPVYGAFTHADLPKLPHGSILNASGSSFERRRLSQAALDILAVGSFALLVCSSAAAVGIIAYVFKLRFFS